MLKNKKRELVLTLATFLTAAVTVANYSVYLVTLIINNSARSLLVLPVCVLICTVAPLLAVAAFGRRVAARHGRLLLTLRIIYLCGLTAYVVSFFALTVYIRSGLEYNADGADTIIVFGGGAYGYTPTEATSRRTERAYELLCSLPDAVCIVSGGGDFPAEADIMASYLISRGIDASRIITESASRDTCENIIYSARIIDELTDPGAVVALSSDYHVKRIELIASDYGLELTTCAVKTPASVGLWSHTVREYMAYIKYFLFTR